MTGFGDTGRISKIYQNLGNGNFSELTQTPFPPVSHSSAEWGDYDNDGDLDIFLCGVDEQGGWLYYTSIYDNNGNDNFIDSGIPFDAVFWGECLWGDYDTDGDLDIVMTGYNSSNWQPFSAIFRNDAIIPNTAPMVPLNLESVTNDNEVILSWDAPFDNETPSSGLTYNAYIISEEDEIIWCSMSDIGNGYRLTNDLGNSNQNTSWRIGELENGNYFWSVQALDNCFEGSEFAAEESFTIGTTGFENPQETKISIYPNPSTGIFKVQLNKINSLNRLSVTNILGKEIFSISGCHKEVMFDLREYGKGIYILRLVSENDIFTSRIFID